MKASVSYKGQHPHKSKLYTVQCGQNHTLLDTTQNRTHTDTETDSHTYRCGYIYTFRCGHKLTHSEMLIRTQCHTIVDTDTHSHTRCSPLLPGERSQEAGRVVLMAALLAALLAARLAAVTQDEERHLSIKHHDTPIKLKPIYSHTTNATFSGDPRLCNASDDYQFLQCKEQ